MRILSRHWWLIAIRGALAIGFAFAALVVPVWTLVLLVRLFGVYLVADGSVALAVGLAGHEGERRWWPLAIEGLIGVVLGTCALGWPAESLRVTIVVLGVWAVATGALEIAAALRLRTALHGELYLGIAGVISILLGALVVRRPEAGAIVVAWLVGAYALLFGAALVALAVRLRRLDAGAREVVEHAPHDGAA